MFTTLKAGFVYWVHRSFASKTGATFNERRMIRLHYPEGAREINGQGGIEGHRARLNRRASKEAATNPKMVFAL
jgi:hypothetical protein